MKIEALSPDNFGALKQFSETLWERPRSEAYYRWRYLKAPGLMTLLAMQNDRCLATLSAFARRYHSGGKTIDCLESFDWATLPEMRGSGVGIRLMKTLLDSGEPMVALGGSADTLQLLPRLGFKTVGAATEFFLPLTGAYLLRNGKLPALARKAIAPLLTFAASAWFKPAKPANGYAFEFLPISRIDERLARIDGPPGFRRVPDPRFLAWLDQGIGTGQYVGMVATRRGAPEAWSAGRLYRASGLLHAVILDFRLAYGDPALAAAGLSAMARALADCGADDVRFATTSDFMAAACRRVGFVAARKKIPAMVWSGKNELDLDSIYLSGGPDGAFWPLQEESPEAGVRFAEWGRTIIRHHGQELPS